MMQLKKDCQDMTKKYFTEKTLTVFLCIMVLGFPILELVCTPIYYTFYLQEPFLKLCGLMLFVFNIPILIGNDKRHFCFSDLLLVASVFFAVLSIVTSLDIRQSLHGQPDYSETPLQTLGYFMAFLTCTQIGKDSSRKTILFAFAGMSIIEMIVGTLQKLKLWPWPAIWGQSRVTCPGVAYGLTENSNFYGTLCVIAVGLFMCLYLFGNPHGQKKWKPVVSYLLAIWAFLCALFSDARLAWVGVAGAILMVLFMDVLLKKKFGKSLSTPRRKWFLLLSFLVLFLLFFFFDPVMSTRRDAILKDFHLIKELASGDADESVLNGLGSCRGYIWRVSIHAWLQRPILGVGFDNLRYAFTMFSDPDMNGYFQDKAHNEYLHYLATQGIFSCLNYLTLCAYVVIKGIKDGVRKFQSGLEPNGSFSWGIQLALLVMAFGYFSQALFSSSITNVAIYKWIIMGLLLPRAEQKELSAVTLSKRSR